MTRFILLLLFCQFTYGQVVIDSYRFGVCDPSASNPNPQENTSNASGYCDENANSVPTTGGGDNQVSPISATVASVSSSGHGYGDYAMEVTATATSGARNRHYWTITNTEIYEYRISYRMTTGSDGRWRFQEGDTAAKNVISISNTGWIETTGEFTANSTRLNLEVYAANTSGSVSDKIEYVFSLKLKDD